MYELASQNHDPSIKIKFLRICMNIIILPYRINFNSYPTFYVQKRPINEANFLIQQSISSCIMQIFVNKIVHHVEILLQNFVF